MFKRASFQNGSLSRTKRKHGPDVWTFRWREMDASGKPIQRRIQVGTVEQYRTETHARKAVAALGLDINRQPETVHPFLMTVGNLVDHYKKHELGAARQSKAESTCDVYRVYIDSWILPHWKDIRLGAVKTVAVEQWLHSLPLADASKSKVRNIFSAVFNHGIRHELATANPIIGPVRGAGVRQSAKRQKDPDVLSPEEIRAILEYLSPQHQLLVMVAASTGLRFSEIRGLQWGDVDFPSHTLKLVRGVVGPHISTLKTLASRKPVPIHPALSRALQEYRKVTPFNADENWIFASSKAKGKVPIWPSSLLADHIQPAVRKAGVQKHVSWHVFRHSYATLLKAQGADVKVVQQSLRHASSRISLDVYTQAIPEDVRTAQMRVVESLKLPVLELATAGAQ